MAVCKNCLPQGPLKFCSVCGEPFVTKRITIDSILHEVFHTLIHFDKGFLYTLKELIIHPGLMQRKYVQGQRTKNQKPFSMFFVCATLYGIAMYFIRMGVGRAEGSSEEVRMHFYRNYFVFMQTALIPVYVFIYWLLFKSKSFNYAEAFISFLYSLCLILILLIPINMVNLIPGHIDERLVEIPVILIYLGWTNLNYFSNHNSLIVIVKSIVLLLLVEFISNSFIDMIVERKFSF